MKKVSLILACFLMVVGVALFGCDFGSPSRSFQNYARRDGVEANFVDGFKMTEIWDDVKTDATVVMSEDATGKKVEQFAIVMRTLDMQNYLSFYLKDNLIYVSDGETHLYRIYHKDDEDWEDIQYILDYRTDTVSFILSEMWDMENTQYSFSSSQSGSFMTFNVEAEFLDGDQNMTVQFENGIISSVYSIFIDSYGDEYSTKLERYTGEIEYPDFSNYQNANIVTEEDFRELMQEFGELPNFTDYGYMYMTRDGDSSLVAHVEFLNDGGAEVAIAVFAPDGTEHTGSREIYLKNDTLYYSYTLADGTTERKIKKTYAEITEQDDDLVKAKNDMMQAQNYKSFNILNMLDGLKANGSTVVIEWDYYDDTFFFNLTVTRGTSVMKIKLAYDYAFAGMLFMDEDGNVISSITPISGPYDFPSDLNTYKDVTEAD